VSRSIRTMDVAASVNSTDVLTRHAWRVPRPEAWWTDLDQYRAKLIDEYDLLLNRFRNAIEASI
jgi:hypothetical protein